MSDGSQFMKRLESLIPPGETEYQVCRRVGVRNTTVRDWKLKRDAGREFCPRISTVRAIAEKLGVTVEWLLLGVGPGPTPKP